MPSSSFRACFALVGLFALWVGAWGYFAPTQVVRALPWPVPGLHARFIAAMYLAGLPLFSFAGPSAWVWFGLLAASGALLASRLLQAKR